MLIFPTLYSSPHDRGIKYACLSTPSAESTPKKKRQRPGREASSSEGRSGRRRTRKKEEGKTLIGNQCPSGLWNIHYSFFPHSLFFFPPFPTIPRSLPPSRERPIICLVPPPAPHLFLLHSVLHQKHLCLFSPLSFRSRKVEKI